MLKRIIIVLFIVLFSVQSNAQIRVYNPDTGKSMNADVLINSGALGVDSGKATSKMTESEKKSLILKDVDKKLGITKQIQEKKAKAKKINLGKVFVFTDVTKFDEDNVEAINKLAESVTKVSKEYYIKPFSSPIALLASGFRAKEELNIYLKDDRGENLARKMHVTKYPEIIYIEPKGQKSRYALSKGGVTALKMRIAEVESTIIAEKDSKKGY